MTKQSTNTQQKGPSKPRVIMIGVDQAIIGLIDQFVNQGKMPHLKKLREGGTSGEAFSCPPCDTPTNWTTISTGATTGVHGCTSFYPHDVGEDFELGLQQRSRSMLSRFCKADYIWDAADREGLTSFVINYPSGWPGSMKNGVMSTYTWNIPESPNRILQQGKRSRFKKTNENEIKTIQPVEQKDIVEKLDSKLTPLRIILQARGAKKDQIAYVCGNDRYNQIVVPSSTKQGENWEKTNLNEWTPFIRTQYAKDSNTIDALYKIKLISVKNQGELIRVEYSSVYSIDGWVNPKKYAEGLIRNALSEDVHYSSEVEYMIDGKIEDFLKEAQFECNGILGALKYMKKQIDWDLAIFHVHFLDTVNHYTLGYLYDESPLIEMNPDYVEEARNNVEFAYKIIDEMVGDIAENIADEQTTIIFVADHGAIPVWKTVNLVHAFSDAGLTKYKFKDGKYVVDWEKTKAFPYFEPHYAWVNLKGRDPQGIISKEEYEQVRDKIIRVLEDLKDPDTGEKIMRAVFKKEDAAFLGQDGERVGDVVYFLNPPYQLFDGSTADLNASEISTYSWSKPLTEISKVCYGAHAYYLPTQKVGKFSVSVPLIVNGPNVKSSMNLRSPVYVTDVAPTIAKILGISRPKDAQGRILHEIFK